MNLSCFTINGKKELTEIWLNVSSEISYDYGCEISYRLDWLGLQLEEISSDGLYGPFTIIDGDNGLINGNLIALNVIQEDINTDVAASRLINISYDIYTPFGCENGFNTIYPIKFNVYPNCPILTICNTIPLWHDKEELYEFAPSGIIDIQLVIGENFE